LFVTGLNKHERNIEFLLQIQKEFQVQKEKERKKKIKFESLSDKYLIPIIEGMS